MKTFEKLSFLKLDNKFLENILKQLLNQYSIIQMFFTKGQAATVAHLIIHVEKNADAIVLQQHKWVKKVKEQFNIVVFFIYSSKFHHRYYLACPFVELYCSPSAMIYQKENADKLLYIKRDWKKYKKKFKLYQERFHHDHDLYSSEIQKLIEEGIANSVFTSYSRLIEYHFDYLEELYIGYNSDHLSLDERITNLIGFLPELQKYFVKDSPSKYHLPQLFEKAKEVSAENELLYDNKMFEAIEIVEQNISGLVVERFGELKKQIKKVKSIKEPTKNEVLHNLEEKSQNQIPELVLQTIVKSLDTEEVYLYHQNTYGEKMIYYLLIIANNVSNEKLHSINQSLKSKLGDSSEFVFIGHNRSWIQNNLYCYQSFFAAIVKDNNRIYSSSNYHPNFHWEAPHEPYHADLYFYYRPVKAVASQIITIADSDVQNYQGIENLFGSFFQSFCRTFIFVKTYYLPNYVSNETLWNMCLYADSSLQNYNYLLANFWMDFFPFIEKHMVILHKFSKIEKQEVFQIKEIVEKLSAELDARMSSVNR